MKYRKGQVYARKMHPGDKAESWITAVQMAGFNFNGGGYVIVRHGGGTLSNTVLTIKRSKRQCHEAFLGGWENAKKFWSMKKKLEKTNAKHT